MNSKLALALAPVVCLAAHSAAAQTATGVGVGTGIATSKSQSQAVAISGQGGAVKNSGNSSLTVNGSPAATTSSINNSGTITERNVPANFAPGLAAAGLETCLGSVSGGGSVVGFGASFGTTVPDPGCAARLDARTLWSFGLKKAALARLCLMPDIYRSMPDVCYHYLPQPPQGYVAPILLQASGEQAAGSIELIDGKTGRQRTCNSYDAPKQRCRVWASR